MAGITHKKVIAGPDHPEFDASSGEWNEPHEVIGDFNVVGGTSEPARPASGVTFFSIDTGVTPNHRMAAGLLVSDPTIPPVYFFDVMI